MCVGLYPNNYFDFQNMPRLSLKKMTEWQCFCKQSCQNSYDCMTVDDDELFDEENKDKSGDVENSNNDCIIIEAPVENMISCTILHWLLKKKLQHVLEPMPLEIVLGLSLAVKYAGSFERKVVQLESCKFQNCAALR